EPLRSFLGGLPEAEDQLLQLKTLLLPRLFKSGAFLWVYIGIGALLAYPIGSLTEWQLAPWLGATAATTTLLASIVIAVCYVRGRRQAQAIHQQLASTLFDTEGAHQRWLHQATSKYQRATAEIRQKHESELQKAVDVYDRAKQLTKDRRNQEILNLNEYPPQM